ncbi:MAG: hypothetical protein K5829_15705 [Treponema sp.]|nr:hypothetical protein [Treponema sp.]
MKKIIGLKKLLIASFMALSFCVSFSSCDLLTAALSGENNEEDEDDEEETVKNIYTFKCTDNKGTYIYYTSTETFKYTSSSDNGDNELHENCIYQISFAPKNTANTSGTWRVYTRPKASTTTIDTVANGTFSGCILEAGEVSLTYEDNSSAGTVTISGEVVTSGTTTDYTGLTFTMDVSKLHSSIGASNEK